MSATHASWKGILSIILTTAALFFISRRRTAIEGSTRKRSSYTGNE